MLCQDDFVPGELYYFKVYANTNGQFNSCIFYIQLLIVISSSGMVAMLGMGAGPSTL
jgi:hypothetical protein